MVRTIDRINPLDLRYTTPGIDPFDEMKLGLWMVRGFYTSDLPGQLVFEGIWTPDFQRVRTPLEGTAMGSNPGRRARRSSAPPLRPECRYRRHVPPRPAEFQLEKYNVCLQGKGHVGNAVQLSSGLVIELVSRHEHNAGCQGQYARRPRPLNLDTNTLNGYLKISP